MNLKPMLLVSDIPKADATSSLSKKYDGVNVLLPIAIWRFLQGFLLSISTIHPLIWISPFSIDIVLFSLSRIPLSIYSNP